MSRKAPEILEAAAGHILSRGKARDQPAGERSMSRALVQSAPHQVEACGAFSPIEPTKDTP